MVQGMGADPNSPDAPNQRGFTLDEIEALIAAGSIAFDENFELIDGEIVPRLPQTLSHLTMKARIADALLAACPADIDIVQGATVVLGERSFFDADILVFRATPSRRYVLPEDVLLAVEITDTSYARDLRTKAPRYGAAGVAELWVVELNEQQTYVFRGPGTAAWDAPVRIGFEAPLSPLFLADAGIRLSELV
jgi:Uma2 family endonuclease